MTSEKRDFFEELEELMDKGHQVAIPVRPESMEEIRRNMKKSIEEYKANCPEAKEETHR